MGRTPCCSGDHAGLKKGPWTREEDEKLTSFLLLNPNTSWRTVPPKAELLRCGKSCRLRWMNYLRPDIKRGNFTPEEENLIIQIHSVVGNKWAVIASQLPGRTDNEIKNLWNTKLRKLLVLKGINPITHQPLCNPLLSDYVKQWFKSIENVIIASIMTQSSSSSTDHLNNSSTTVNSFVDHQLPIPSFMSLPLKPPVQQLPLMESYLPNNPISDQSTTIDTSFWVHDDDETFRNGLVDDLTALDEGGSVPSCSSEHFLRELDLEEKVNDYSSVLTETASSGATLDLEEGFKYWN